MYKIYNTELNSAPSHAKNTLIVIHFLNKHFLLLVIRLKWHENCRHKMDSGTEILLSKKWWYYLFDYTSESNKFAFEVYDFFKLQVTNSLINVQCKNFECFCWCKR